VQNGTKIQAYKGSGDAQGSLRTLRREEWLEEIGALRVAQAGSCRNCGASLGFGKDSLRTLEIHEEIAGFKLQTHERVRPNPKFLTLLGFATLLTHLGFVSPKPALCPNWVYTNPKCRVTFFVSLWIWSNSHL
jgi:hypothetical protein